jgi:hypothetical protein
MQHNIAESYENSLPYCRDNRNILTAKERTEISRLTRPQVMIRRPTGKWGEAEAHSLENNFCVTLALALLVGAYWLKEVKIRSLHTNERLIRYGLMLDQWILMSGWIEDGWRERRNMCILRDIKWSIFHVTLHRGHHFKGFKILVGFGI